MKPLSSANKLSFKVNKTRNWRKPEEKSYSKAVMTDVFINNKGDNRVHVLPCVSLPGPPCPLIKLLSYYQAVVGRCVCVVSISWSA